MARDPYKYFRIEAKELLEGLTHGALELEKGADQGVIGKLLRLAHTLKGASRVVRQPEIAEIAHRIEDVLAPYREGAAVPTAESTSKVLRLIDDIAARLSVLGSAPADSPAPSGAAVPPRPAKADAAAAAPGPSPASPPLAIAETVRIDIEDTDRILHGISESAVRVGSLLDVVREIQQLESLALGVAGDLAPARGPSVRDRTDALRARVAAIAELAGGATRRLTDGVERAERELRQLQDDASRMRLVSADTIFAPLSRAVRDAAQAMDRTVAFETAGGGVRLDAHVLAALRDALLHVVRNAVAHGIEPARERAAAGKPPTGQIRLLVERRGSRAVFSCRDDGRGVDVEAVGRVARERGLLPADPSHAVDAATAAQLIFEPGVSTSRSLTEISGRGVGLDVVRDVAGRFKGEARVDSVPGRGTTVEISVPISLSSMPALAVAGGGGTSWIPLEAVVRTVRVTEGEIARAPHGASIEHDGKAVLFSPLAAILRESHDRPSTTSAWTTVIVRADDALAAVGVERLLGVSRIVVRPLPVTVGVFPAVAGATFDAFGQPQLVLDPRGLADSMRGVTTFSMAKPAATRLPILIIDDSLTTRMLEQSILETAGYEVELAESAEEGLAKARARRFGLILVDVEMPGMNGFEFIATAKADPALSSIPAIIVTSLNSPEDRRRGMEVGAHAHIVKGEFDEGRLRGLIRDLVG